MHALDFAGKLSTMKIWSASIQLRRCTTDSRLDYRVRGTRRPTDAVAVIVVLSVMSSENAKEAQYIVFQISMPNLSHGFVGIS